MDEQERAWHEQLRQAVDRHLQTVAAAKQQAAGDGMTPVAIQLLDVIRGWLDQLVGLDGFWVARWKAEQHQVSVKVWLVEQSDITRWAPWDQRELIAEWPWTVMITSHRESSAHEERHIVKWRSPAGYVPVMAFVTNNLGLLDRQDVDDQGWREVVLRTVSELPASQWFDTSRGRAQRRRRRRITRKNLNRWLWGR